MHKQFGTYRAINISAHDIKAGLQKYDAMSDMAHLLNPLIAVN